MTTCAGRGETIQGHRQFCELGSRGGMPEVTWNSPTVLRHRMSFLVDKRSAHDALFMSTDSS